MTTCITNLLILNMISIAMGPRILILAQQQIPCYFIFGDTIFDNGNNNILNTRVKTNYFPYGIDYAYGTTGRSTNGANIPDIIAQRLGLPRSSPPFATADGTIAIVRGLNYASSTGGILDETSYQWGDQVSMNEQLNNHQRTIHQLADILQNQTTTDNLLNQCLYTINIGRDDYLTNYFSRPPVNLNRVLFTPDAFAQNLIYQYSQQLLRLYNLQARKIAVFGILPIGCIPYSLSQYPTGGSQCIDVMNNAVKIFNNKLISLVKNLNNNLPNARFTYINLYGILSGNLSSIGVKNSIAPCCEVDRLTQTLCVRNGKVCRNRDEYEFFDNLHPTTVVYNFSASRALNAQLPTDATPFDIVSLVKVGL